MTRITLRGLLARKLRLALTALAIVLGVTFVTGTLVLTDTLNRTFDTLIGTAYQHVNFQIRGTRGLQQRRRGRRERHRRPQADPGVDRARGPPPARRRIRGRVGRRLRPVRVRRQRDRRRRLGAGVLV